MGENETEGTSPKNPLQRILALLPKNQLILYGSLIVGVLVVALLAFWVISSTSKSAEKKQSSRFVIAFEALTTIDAAKIRESLTYENIKFKDVKKGKVIDLMVPENMADEARMKMAQQGLPEGGVVGFEIFDRKGDLGATDYDRRIKYMRALSGELSRNISHLKEIQTARVQIVMPEKKAFGKQVPGSASVIVNLAEGVKFMTAKQVKGIMHLVASSVENLPPENVTVLNAKGEILSEKIQFELVNKDTIFGSLFTMDDEDVPALEKLLRFQSRYKAAVEKELDQKIQIALIRFFPITSYSIVANVTLIETKESVSNPYQVAKVDVAVMIDANDETISMDTEKKQAVTDAVAAAIGFVKDRDTISITRTPFIKADSNVKVLDTATKEPRTAAAERDEKASVSFAFKYMFIFVIVTMVFLIVGKQLFFKSEKVDLPNIDEEEELMTSPRIIQLQNHAMENPSYFVNKINEWLKEDAA